MANTRLVTVLTKQSNQPSSVLPVSAATGEALVNTADGKVFYKGFISGTGSTTYVPFSGNSSFFEVGSHVTQLKIDDKITSYSGVSNLSGLFLSGTSTGFVLASTAGIVSSDTYLTGGTFNPTTHILTLNQNNGGPTVSVTGFTDLYVTGGTMNAGLGTATFTNSTGGTFQVTGFTTSGGAAGVTAVTVNNNVISVISNGGGTNNFTINAATGGTYSSTAGTITLLGSGTLSTISGIQTLYNSDGTLTGNRNVSLSSSTLTFSSTSQSTLLTLTGSNVGIGITASAVTNTLHVSAATNPVRFQGIAQTGVDVNILSTDVNGVVHFRTDVLTGIASLCAATLTNNVLSVIKNGSVVTATTINAITGGTYSNGTITSTGSGTIANITGLIASAVTSTTLTNNILSVTQAQGPVTATTIQAVTGGTYSSTAATITLLGSGTLTNITGLINPYNGDDTLTGNRRFSLSSNTLTFSSTTQGNLLVLTGSNIGIGVTATGVTNALHVSAATNPIRVVGLATNVSDTTLVSTDTTGVFHTITLSSISGASAGITGLTVVNNVISATLTNSTTTATTINAATGGTLSNGTITLAGSGTLSTISGIPLATPFVSAFTYSNNVFTILNNTGGTLTALINTITGLTVNGILTVTGNTFVSGNTTNVGNVTAASLFTASNGQAIIGTGGLIVGSGGSPDIPGTGDVIINGSLTVFGASVSAFTSNLYSEDNNISLNYNPTGNTFATSLTGGFNVQNGLGVSGLTGDSVFYQIAQTGVPSNQGDAYAKRFWETNLFNIMVGSTGGTGTGNYVLVTNDTLNGGSY